MSYFDVGAFRCTCRTYRDISVTNDQYLLNQLKVQFRERTDMSDPVAGAQHIEYAYQSVLKLMNIGFVLSGGMLFAMLHNEVWRDSKDFDMYRYQSVRFQDGTWENHTWKSEHVSRNKSHAALEVTPIADWIVETMDRLAFCSPITRSYTVKTESENPWYEEFHRDPFHRERPQGVISHTAQVPLPGVYGMTVNLLLLVDKGPNGKREGVWMQGQKMTPLPTSPLSRCILVSTHIIKFDMRFLQSMWTRGQLVLLSSAATRTKRGTLERGIPALTRDEISEGIPPCLRRAVKYANRGCTIRGGYQDHSREIVMCPTCLGPKLLYPSCQLDSNKYGIKHACAAWEWIKKLDWKNLSASTCAFYWSQYYAMY